jgi:hypothetical protein
MINNALILAVNVPFEYYLLNCVVVGMSGSMFVAFFNKAIENLK